MRGLAGPTVCKGGDAACDHALMETLMTLPGAQLAHSAELLVASQVYSLA